MVAASKFQVSETQFRPEVAAIAQALGMSLASEPDLQRGIMQLLQARDEQSRVDNATSLDNLVLRAVLHHCHQANQEKVFVSKIAEAANDIYREEGESLRISSETAGRVLKNLGLYSRRLGNAGRGARFGQVDAVSSAPVSLCVRCASLGAILRLLSQVANTTNRRACAGGVGLAHVATKRRPASREFGVVRSEGFQSRCKTQRRKRSNQPVDLCRGSIMAPDPVQTIFADLWEDAGPSQSPSTRITKSQHCRIFGFLTSRSRFLVRQRPAL